MRVRVGRPGLRKPRRADIAAGAVVLIFVFCICALGTGLFIQLELKPKGPGLGVPTRLVFPLCGGRSYALSGEAISNEGPFGPTTIEPTIGKVPLFDLFHCPMSDAGFYYAVIYLHLGGDQYQAYSLEGGP